MPKRALVLIDIQNDYFPGGRWALAGIESAADNAARVLAAAREPHARGPDAGAVPPDERLERLLVPVAGVPVEQVPVGAGGGTQESQDRDHHGPT